MRQAHAWLAVAVILLGTGWSQAEEFAAEPAEIPAAVKSEDGPVIPPPTEMPKPADASVPNEAGKPSGAPSQGPAIASSGLPPSPGVCGEACTPCIKPSCHHCHCRHIWQWLTYRPLSSCCGCCDHPCQPCGVPPLYIFFLCDRFHGPALLPCAGHPPQQPAAASGSNSNKDKSDTNDTNRNTGSGNNQNNAGNQ